MQFVLRATGSDARILEMLEARGITNRVALASPLPYLDALSEMLAADGLLLLQGYTSNPAIPAKLYEYLRARKPILALTDRDGSTAALLKRLGTAIVASLEEVDQIERAIIRLHDSIEQKSYSFPADENVAEFSRRALSGDLASLLDSLSTVDISTTRTHPETRRKN